MQALFNTLARKREKSFQSLCATFVKQGVATNEQAEACYSTLLDNAKTYTAFIILTGLSLAIVFQGVALPIMVFIVVALLYIVTATYRARRLTRRFIEDVLNTDEYQQAVKDQHK